jgi:hypothetical protein
VSPFPIKPLFRSPNKMAADLGKGKVRHDLRPAGQPENPEISQFPTP